ncbi:MAG TPA: hypothetical protein VF172_13445 [Nitrososphaera sp.]|jgi:hypothetical protein
MKWLSDIDLERISRPSDKSKIILESGSQKNQGFVVQKIEIRQYIERTDDRLGDYSLLTAVVETDRGTVEMKYDEGFRGPDALESAVTLLTRYVGLASLINRALIELQRQQDK